MSIRIAGSDYHFFRFVSASNSGVREGMLLASFFGTIALDAHHVQDHGMNFP